MTHETILCLFFNFLLFHILCITAARSGEYLVLSDIHLDLIYDKNFGPDTFCKDLNIYPEYELCGSATHSSDVKFNPLYQNDFGALGCDTPFSTFSSAVQSMKEYQPNPDFILVLGDWVAHCAHDMNSLLHTLHVAANIIKQTFPSVPVISAIGNNDVYPHDTLAIGENEMLHKLYDIWSEWIPNEDQKQTFVKGGYYASTPLPGLRIITLNTLYYFNELCTDNSTSSCADYLGEDDDPAGQFDWLADQLSIAESSYQSVIIMSHVTPSRARSFHSLWITKYQHSFYEIISEYSSIIKGIYFGHIHRDSFSLLIHSEEDGEDEVVGKIVNFPSLSPISKNNPAYRIMQYDLTSYTTMDMRTYYYNMELYRQYQLFEPIWELEYKFSEVYSAGFGSLIDMCNKILNDNAAYFNFRFYWGSLSEIAMFDDHSPSYYFYCMLSTFFNEDFDNCVLLNSQSR